jgi:hypothetical protein
VTVILLQIVCVLSAPSINVTTINEGLLTERAFAYAIVSDTEVSLSNSNYTNVIIQPEYQVFANESGKFLFPVDSYPMVLAYNIPQLNSSLVLTRELLQKIATDPEFTWDNAELVSLNPGLEILSFAATRIIVNRTPNPINGQLMTYIFDNATDFGDDWKGVATGSVSFGVGWTGVLSLLPVLPNSISFLPLPMVFDALSKNIRIGGILEDGVISTYSETVPTTITTTDNWLTIRHETNWPIHIVEYGIYDPDNQSEDCQDALEIMRFMYWTVGNQRLHQTDAQKGFLVYEDTVNTEIQNHLLKATCGGSLLLKYENLSVETRTNAVFSITLIVTVLLGVMVFLNWRFTKNRYDKMSIGIHVVVILGLALSFVSYVIWWYPSSVTWRCTTRMWFLNLGFANVVASPTLHMVLLGFAGKKAKSGNIAGVAISKKQLLAVYPIMMIIEVVILILWNTLENPKAHENIISVLDWQTNYTCETKSGVWQTVQFVYYCVIALFGCIIFYSNWNQKGSNEANRWLMVSLYNQIFVFFQLLIILSILQLNDESLYVIIVPFYLFAQVNVVCSFFIPKLFAKYKDRKDITSRTESQSPKSISNIEMSKVRRTTSDDVIPV